MTVRDNIFWPDFCGAVTFTELVAVEVLYITFKKLSDILSVTSHTKLQ